MKISLTEHIDAPREKVFNVFTNLKNAPNVINGITKIEVLEGEEIQMGTKWRETRIMLGKEATEVMWVTGFEQNKSYTVEAESNGAHYTSVYLFTQVNNGTDVEMTFEGTPVTFAGRLMSILGPFCRSNQKSTYAGYG